MSLFSADDWYNFLFKVGQDFYDLVNGDEDAVVTPSFYYNYKGVGAVHNYDGGSPSNNYIYTADVTISKETKEVLQNVNFINCYNNTPYNWRVGDLSITKLNSFQGYNIRVNSSNQIEVQKANGSWTVGGFSYVFSYTNQNNWLYSNSATTYLQFGSFSPKPVLVSNGDGSYTLTGNYPTFNNSSNKFTYTLPAVLTEYPALITDTNSYTYTTINNYVTNNYSWETYNYTTNQGDTITIKMCPETGDIIPDFSVPLSYDDLFDMFNTLIAPIVNVTNDFPDDITFPSWYDITGGGSTDIIIPDVTGEYPAETITPIESDIYNIMSIDSMPQLPSLTGIDNGESAVALGSSFTFLDGCGLFMPFVTIAIIRLLISKFRGDS